MEKYPFSLTVSSTSSASDMEVMRTIFENKSRITSTTTEQMFSKASQLDVTDGDNDNYFYTTTQAALEMSIENLGGQRK
ncbi:hypothetical protein CEXT_123331 [Caerostris extrusa]|uniref:Uncharacterized protein n=1 Tax=Caerostris extrusa TaxID=172846 RepID=A0AAV4W8K9_CAEEX|nr:hypothetical protein CEXT_123331 [Caerostris extrusa]